MLKSMTAYGRSTINTPLGRFIAEIQSVNRKHLEMNTILSKELQRFDHDIRKTISSAITRGQVTVKLFVHFDQTSPVVVAPNIPLARQIASAWEQIAKDLKLAKDIDLAMLASQEDILVYDEELHDEEGYRQMVAEVLDKALTKFMDMRLLEGKALQADIAERLENLKNCLDQIAVKAPTATTRYRQKLIDRLNEVLPGAVENEERILREVCIYAERIDIAEEITRFNSHLDQCRELLQSTASHIGKTFEFLLQELGREINTIGSKSSDIDVSRLVIAIKSDLERIREQIQNVE